MALDLNVVDDVIEQRDRRIAELEAELAEFEGALRKAWEHRDWYETTIPARFVAPGP